MDSAAGNRQNGTPSQVTAAEEYSWTVHPFAEKPYATIFVIIVFAAFAKISYDFTGSFGMAAFGLVLLFASLAQFFFPTRYQVTREAVRIKILFYSREEKLSKFRKFHVDRNGIFLSSEPESKVLDQFRGLFLIARGEHREKAAAVLRGVFPE